MLMSFSMLMSKTRINLNMLMLPVIMFTLITMIFTKTTKILNLTMNSDNLTTMMIILSIMSSSLIMISSNNMKSIYFTIYPIMLILMTIFFCSNMFWFYILFETVLIPTTILITKDGKQPERLQAGIYIIIYTIIASLPLLVCILSMKNNYSFYFSFMMLHNCKLPLLMIMAFLVKMPMFFSHLWLPKAHVEASLEGSMILAAVLLKLGGYGLIRIIPLCFMNMQLMKSWIISISMLGASMTSLNCMRQKDMKALIAYSSVAHMAMTLASIMTLNQMGLNGAIMMMIAHGFSSSALFLLVNDLYMKIHSRNIIMFKGLLSITPNITFWWFIFMTVNMSAPPSINTLSEMFIMSSMMMWTSYMFLPIILASFLTASFCLSLYINITHNKNEMKFFVNTSPKLFLSLFSHLIPLILMITKMESMTL